MTKIQVITDIIIDRVREKDIFREKEIFLALKCYFIDIS